MIDRFAAAELTPERFAAWREAGRPALLEGAASPLDLDALAAELGPRRLKARLYGERIGRPKRDWPGYCDFLELNLADYARLLESREAHRRRIYLAQIPVGGRPAAEAEAIAERLGLKAMSDANLWIGPGGHVEPLHYDPMDGVLMQLRGAKQVRLLPPAETRNLYPFPLLGGALRPWFSQAYLESPAADQPRLADAARAMVTVELGEGDALYMPAGWWHEVTARGEDYVVSVNRFQQVRPLSRLLGVRLGAPLYAAFAARRLVQARPSRAGGDRAGKSATD
jgi:lysine-specific demethylase 8/hypoxia-inducible factor 1-alpha inhibitor (HIF hydroxylase)